MPDFEYHLSRARAERDIAYISPHPMAADTHMRLSALHLARALLLQEVQRRPVGNVVPLRPQSSQGAKVEVVGNAGIRPVIAQGEGQ